MKFSYKFNILVICLWITFISKYESSRLKTKRNINSQFIHQKLKHNNNSIQTGKTITFNKIQTNYTIYNTTGINNSHIESILHINVENNAISKKLINLVNLYLQFFVIFTILAFHRWFEEMIKIKMNRVENTYSTVKDLTKEENKKKPLSDFEGEYVFTSGKTKILSPALDDEIIFEHKKYAVIERKVEYFDITVNKWLRLYSIPGRADTIAENPEFSFNGVEQDSTVQLFFSGEIYTFPKIISKIFFGEVEINDVAISNVQMLGLKNYETIKIPKQTKYESTPEGYNPVQFEIQNDYIIIYPCDMERTESKKSNCKLRISYRGFELAKVSVMAKLKNKSFRSYHTPYDCKEDQFSDSPDFVNRSTNMVLTPNFNFDLCNLLCCFCLSGPATYNSKDEVLQNTNTSTSTINWIFEKEVTLKDMIYEKHYISKLNHFFYRLLFFVTLFCAFMIFPGTLELIYKILNFNPDKIKANFIKYNLLACKVLISLTYVLSCISYKTKHCLNIILVFLITIFILIFSLFTIKNIIFSI